MKTKIIILLCIIALCSCKNDRHLSEIHCEFNGAIILDVHSRGICGSPLGADAMYVIKYQGEILEFIQPYQIDANYSVGDTIKGNCIK